ncbi:G-protein gamma subunit [Hesseltinella vesiculosa]|uniref:Guanine nucleotide-binding protein subunit gamma n=1 Tax=Hesseltinella vesiculosa TaxID=101127 RepID=A0A1X2GCL0_9FUNG|nr:G-protein gamma subunit [Hesseltinella vesiculosa]
MSLSNKRLQISQSKLQKIEEYNKRLTDQLNMQCIATSEASESLIRYCNATNDPLLPSIWGKVEKEDDPYAPSTTSCCVIS